MALVAHHLRVTPSLSQIRTRLLVPCMVNRCHRTSRLGPVRCAATVQDAPVESLEAYYEEGAPLPDRRLGPVKPTMIPGRGRGLVATEVLEPGALIMVSDPISILYNKEGDDTPDMDQVVGFLMDMRQYTPLEMALLKTLYRGQGGLEIPDFDKIYAENSNDEDLAEDFESSGLTVEDMIGIVGLNTYEEYAADLPTAITRNDSTQPFSGLWPEFCLLNHSCLPNAICYVMGEKMIVRAIRRLREGDEVTVSYLGRSTFIPLQERQYELQNQFGFECQCPRCKLESLEYPGTSDLLSHIFEGLTDTQERLLSAMGEVDQVDEEGDVQWGEEEGQLADGIRNDLEAVIQNLERVMGAQGVQEPFRTWLRASALHTYLLLGRVWEIGPHQMVNELVLQMMMSISGEVAPASDLDLFLNLKNLKYVAQTHGPSSLDAKMVKEECEQIIRVRYGEVGPEMMEKLMLASMQAMAYTEVNE